MSGPLAGVSRAEAETGSGTLTIEAAGLAKRYGETEAVKGVSFLVQPGEIFAFLGRTARGRPPRCGCCAHWPGRPAAGLTDLTDRAGK